MPSTTAQFFGFCYGPGHHAPMVRVPNYRPIHTQRFEFQPASCQQCAMPNPQLAWTAPPNANYQYNGCPAPGCLGNPQPTPTEPVVTSPQPAMLSPNPAFAPPANQPIPTQAQPSGTPESISPPNPPQVPAPEAIPAPGNLQAQWRF
ncbi:MAG: hypothetical protein GXP26_15125 [Planctomycetes bacterium]|nr:hypothetical protein [Planctomycetota bacterium]